MHGYEAGMSTVTALVEIQTRLVHAVEKGNVSSLCLLDVSCGFDTVSHTFLLRKFEMYGYCDNSLEWLASYLGNRIHKVQVQASFSDTVVVDIGFPQGGPMSPVLFREYGNDIPACMVAGCQTWDEGEKEDQGKSEELTEEDRSPITRAILRKNAEERTSEEKWDLQLIESVNNISRWRSEKTGVGPEPQLVPDSYSGSPEATIYADDNSAGEEAKTKDELKNKTEKMLRKIVDHMRAGRLLINAGKTK